MNEKNDDILSQLENDQLLIKSETEKHEKFLYECALAVENDCAFNDGMKEWDTTLQDGLKHESW
jgi:hypothetical protein